MNKVLPPIKVKSLFYDLADTKLKKIRTLDLRAATKLCWSPVGGYLIASGLGILEFIDMVNVTTVATHEHFQCSSVEWDPSGRYVISAANLPIGDPTKYRECGYRLWTFQGQQLANIPLDTSYQILWRPRPPSLLSKEQIDEKVLRDKYWIKFEKLDDLIIQSHQSEVEKRKSLIKEQWKAYREAQRRDYAEEANLREQLRNGLVSDEEQDVEVIDQYVEEEILEKRQEIIE